MNSKSIPLILALLCSVTALVAALWLGTNPIEQAHLAARYTARAGVPIFMLTYAASSLALLWPNRFTHALMRNRFYCAMGFVVTHTIHLIVFSYFLWVSGETQPDFIIKGGIAGYVLLYALALTSNQAAIEWMGKWWKVLHHIGVHTLCFMFTMTYLSKVSDPEQMSGAIIPLLICLSAIAVRIAAWGKLGWGYWRDKTS